MGDLDAAVQEALHRPQCCASALAMYDNDALRWRAAEPAHKWRDVLGEIPPGPVGEQVAEKQFSAAKPARYEAVTDWDYDAVEYTTVAFCPFCGAKLEP